jgi:hypothetical protein
MLWAAKPLLKRRANANCDANCAHPLLDATRGVVSAPSGCWLCCEMARVAGAMLDRLVAASRAHAACGSATRVLMCVLGWRCCRVLGEAATGSCHPQAGARVSLACGHNMSGVNGEECALLDALPAQAARQQLMAQGDLHLYAYYDGLWVGPWSSSLSYNKSSPVVLIGAPVVRCSCQLLGGVCIGQLGVLCPQSAHRCMFRRTDNMYALRSLWVMSSSRMPTSQHGMGR